MKISKLFHWLYAIVMLLPIFAIGITCGYAMFNKNAYQSYASNNLNEITYNQLESNNFIYNQTYYVNTRNIDRSENSNIYLYDFELINTLGFSNSMIENLNNNNIYRLNWAETGNISIYSIENDVSTWLMALNPDTMSLSFNCKLYNLSGVAYKNVYSIVYHNETFLSEVFYYSVDRVTQSNMFNWAYDSFLVAPFSYIVNLFSMPTNSPVVMLLSYWLSISIIWLTFDLIMYVPLLVHRWLDKGVLE